MRSEALFAALGGVSETWIEEAAPEEKRPRLRWVKPTLIAAALCLVAGLGLFCFSLMGGRAGGGGVPGSGTANGGGGTEESGEGYAYMSYAGPVLPMTALGDTDGITAERSVDWNFSPYAPEEHSYVDPQGETHSYTIHESAALVTDSYILHNDTDEDRTLTLLYPSAESIRSDALPTLTAAGETLEPRIHFGSFAGGFADAVGDEGGLRLNLRMPEAWEDYAALLADGSYLADALREKPELDQPVILYRIYDIEVPPNDATNPTLQIDFTLDFDRTKILTYNANGGTNDRENGYMARHIGGLDRAGAQREMLLAVLGEDIGDYTLQGYRNGGCEPGEELAITARVERTESTLSAVLHRAQDLFLEIGDPEQRLLNEPYKALCYDLAAELLRTYGVLSEDPAERYGIGMLEDVLSEAMVLRRVLYLEAEVTVPARGSLTVSASYVKHASYDFYGTGRGQTTQGYDLATRLGTSLVLTEQRASLSETGQIEIVENNFGFDLPAGVSTVTLDPETEHYWMKIKVK